jgi:hypothetical protein
LGQLNPTTLPPDTSTGDLTRAFAFLTADGFLDFGEREHSDDRTLEDLAARGTGGFFDSPVFSDFLFTPVELLDTESLAFVEFFDTESLAFVMLLKGARLGRTLSRSKVSDFRIRTSLGGDLHELGPMCGIRSSCKSSKRSSHQA